MSKFNHPRSTAIGSGPLQAELHSSGKTHEGGTGYQRDVRSELFLRATCNFAGEDTFYEDASTADARSRELVHQLAVTDDGWTWVQEFLPWLRKDGNIRSASVMLAAEAVKARLDKGLIGEGNRQLISVVLQRADEPGEMLAYWMSRYGRAIPKPVKRGVADAVKMLYTERNFLRYDKRESAIRFGDVLELTHAKPWPQVGGKLLPGADGGEGDSLDIQGVLFKWAITARHNRDEEPPAELKAVSARRELSKLAPADRRVFAALVHEGDTESKIKFRLALAGQWEWARSWLLEGDG